jgi:aminoglycoside/choline kinase family phosphotransferase
MQAIRSEHLEENFSRFLKSHYGSEDFRVYQLAGDASNRRYYRVIFQNQSWVLMSWEPFDANNYPFLSVLNHFAKHKINVPEVVAMDASLGLVLLEDLGDLTLERKFWESQEQEASLPYYEKALDEIVKIHFPATLDKGPCTAFHIQFDVEKFLWEMNYGKDNLLTGMCKFNISEKAQGELDKAFLDICEKLHKEPKYIAHRDYHSRNLMIKFDEMRVIDFQDARMGPIQYDLVSLIRDSYVNIHEGMEEKLIEMYLLKAKSYLPKDFSRDHFNEVFELQTIQRCFKACGSFSSFYNLRNDTRYLKYISHTLKRVLKSLSEFSQYKVFTDILIDSGALERKYDVL